LSEVNTKIADEDGYSNLEDCLLVFRSEARQNGNKERIMKDDSGFMK